MMRSSRKALGGFFLAALIGLPAWSAIPPQPGTINYIEGQAAMNGQTLTDESVGSARLPDAKRIWSGVRQPPGTIGRKQGAALNPAERTRQGRSGDEQSSPRRRSMMPVSSRARSGFDK